MKYFFALVLCSYSLLPCAQAQSARVGAEITLVAPAPTCAFSVISDLDFGTAEKPTSSTGSVTISATTGTRSASGLSIAGTSSVGQVRLSGSNVASYSVSRTFPSTLTASSDNLSFSGTWAQSSRPSSDYSSIANSSYSGTASGVGSTFTQYFRFGGAVSDISLNEESAVYSGTITTSATCN